MPLPKVYNRKRRVLAESSDEEEEDDEQQCVEIDEESDAESNDSFVVSDTHIDPATDTEPEDDEEVITESEQHSTEDEEEEEDTTDATYGHTYEQALRVIRRSRHFDVHIEADTQAEEGKTFCFRIRDSNPGLQCGEYQVLLESLEKILGRDAVREDEDENKHWMAGIRPFVRYTAEVPLGKHSFFGCLCNQNPMKMGGLKQRYGMQDEKTGIVFLYGSECASHHMNIQANDLGEYYHKDAYVIGPARATKAAKR